MLETIMQGLIEWMYSLFVSMAEYIFGDLIDVLTMDMTYFRKVAPVVDDISEVILALGWAMLIGNLIFQLIKSMMSGIGFEGEDPRILFMRTFVFSFLLLASKQICELCTSITKKVVMILSVPSSFKFNAPESSSFNAAGANWLISVIVGIILIIQLVKLFFDIGERYVITSVLTFMAPLAFAMGGSRNTNDIFKGWCRMYGSMNLMLVMNIVFLKLIIDAMTNMQSSGIILWLVFVVALTRSARKIDAHIAKIGLNPAQSGGGVGIRFPGGVTMIVVKSLASLVSRNAGNMKSGSGRSNNINGNPHPHTPHGSGNGNHGINQNPSMGGGSGGTPTANTNTNMNVSTEKRNHNMNSNVQRSKSTGRSEMSMGGNINRNNTSSQTFANENLRASTNNSSNQNKYDINNTGDNQQRISNTSNTVHNSNKMNTTDFQNRAADNSGINKSESHTFDKNSMIYDSETSSSTSCNQVIQQTGTLRPPLSRYTSNIGNTANRGAAASQSSVTREAKAMNGDSFNYAKSVNDTAINVQGNRNNTNVHESGAVSNDMKISVMTQNTGNSLKESNSNNTANISNSNVSNKAGNITISSTISNNSTSSNSAPINISSNSIINNEAGSYINESRSNVYTSDIHTNDKRIFDYGDTSMNIKNSTNVSKSEQRIDHEYKYGKHDPAAVNRKNSKNYYTKNNSYKIKQENHMRGEKNERSTKKREKFDRTRSKDS